MIVSRQLAIPWCLWLSLLTNQRRVFLTCRPIKLPLAVFSRCPGVITLRCGCPYRCHPHILQCCMCVCLNEWTTYRLTVAGAVVWSHCSCLITLSQGQMYSRHQSCVCVIRKGGRWHTYYVMTKVIVAAHGCVELLWHLLWLLFSLSQPVTTPPASARMLSSNLLLCIHVCMCIHWVWGCDVCVGLSWWRTEQWIRDAQGAGRV